MKARFTAALAGILLIAGTAVAANVTGQVINGTTSRPAGGDRVELLALSQGMQSIASTTADAGGNFKFDVPDDGMPHMVRVTHQGTNYFPQGGPLMPGATSTSVQVYDVTKKPEGLSTTVNVARYQSDGGSLQVTELYAIQNSSTPPRTVYNPDATYEFVLPENAAIDSAGARGPGGQPVTTQAVPLSKKGHYAFVFPLRPGETQFQVAYHLSYNGAAMIVPKPLVNMQHFVIMAPKSMKLAPKLASMYSPMPDENGSAVQVASNVTPSSDLAFQISGTGTLQDTNDGGQGQPPSGQMGAGQTGRPGGGLGPPIDAPDPLARYRWFVLGGLVVAMLLAALIVSRRGPAPVIEEEAEMPAPAPVAVAAAAVKPAANPVPAKQNRSSVLLDAMKEELFQLEIDRQQKTITEEEYQKTKAALDETIRRALSRKAETA